MIRKEDEVAITEQEIVEESDNNNTTKDRDRPILPNKDSEELEKCEKGNNDDRSVINICTENMANNYESQEIEETAHGIQTKIIEEIYDEVIQYKRNNLFTPSSGKALETMINEMTTLINNYNNNCIKSHIALKWLMIMPKLLLQKPHTKSTSKDNNEAFKRRVKEW